MNMYDFQKDMPETIDFYLLQEAGGSAPGSEFVSCIQPEMLRFKE